MPALLGIPGRFPVLTTLIYQRLNGFGPEVIGRVAAMALVLVALAVGALALRQALVARLSVPVGAGAAFAGFAPGRWRWPLLAATWMVLIWIAVLPMVALVTTSLVPALGVPLGPDTATLRNFDADDHAFQQADIQAQQAYAAFIPQFFGRLVAAQVK